MSGPRFAHLSGRPMWERCDPLGERIVICRLSEATSEHSDRVSRRQRHPHSCEPKRRDHFLWSDQARVFRSIEPVR